MVDVIIFFVGLTLWTNDGGTKAILPTVNHTTQAHTAPHVQDHKAAIVFYKASYDPQSTWGPPIDLASRGGDAFQYVELDGDSLSFKTGNAQNAAADLDDLLAPHLKQDLCGAKATLRPYLGAAAVISVPEGKLQSCLGLPADSPGRIDTQLDLDTNGTLVISSSTSQGTKELRLRPRPPRVGSEIESPKIELMIANVPATYFDDDYTTPALTAHNGVSHMRVYEEMSDPQTVSNCKSIEDWWHELENPDPIPLCDDIKFPASGPFDPPPPSTTMVAVAASFDCSNSQWP